MPSGPSSEPPDRSRGQSADPPLRHPTPRSIRVSVRLVLALVALSFVNAVLTYVYLDEMAAAAVAAQGADLEVDEETVRASLVTVTVADLVGLGVLRVVLARALTKGARWARVVLTALAVLSLTFGAMGLRVGTDRPPAFMVTGVVALALQGALLYFLWRQESSDFLRPAGSHPGSRDRR
jgi:hypothetical protein